MRMSRPGRTDQRAEKYRTLAFAIKREPTERLAAAGRELADWLRKIERDTLPFSVPRAYQRGARWVDPRLVAEVTFTTWVSVLTSLGMALVLTKANTRPPMHSITARAPFSRMLISKIRWIRRSFIRASKGSGNSARQ
jgi:hypothetical protein